ncbi:MAG TPA: glycosyltransferase [Acidimicrobiales bacterium]|jgi:spore maturation protein CgeB|nr:glycosyltransferase [Acidimicrobiales bacterium]
MADGLDIAFFGSSIVSSWWNGACTYYRGIIRGLHAHGHRVTFYEPIAYERQEHRDIADPDYCDVVIYPADDERQVRKTVDLAARADVVVKTSGVGVFDDVLEDAVAHVGDHHTTRIFWDVDAPATLSRVEGDRSDPFRRVLPEYDMVLTYGGGDPVVDRYTRLGAREVVVVYNALDPTTHHAVPRDPRFDADCALLANRLPDREARIDEFFFRAASLLPERTFLLGGNGWQDKAMPPNVRWIGHVGTDDHNAFNCTPRTVLNVTRDSMVANGWSPATRVFEAAGAGACLITDAWDGIDEFLAPYAEVLVAHDGADVARCVDTIDASHAQAIGARAAARVLSEHTYDHRAAQLDRLLRSRVRAGAAA